MIEFLGRSDASAGESRILIECVPETRGPGRRRAWRRGLMLGGLALSLGLAACASIEARPTPSERRGGAGRSRGRFPRRQVRSGSVLSTPSAASIARRRRKPSSTAFSSSSRRLSDAAGQPYRVTLLDSPVVNAFALPSGDIFMTRGLIALANDTAEIAAVMAHEIAHVTARHAAQRAEFVRTPRCSPGSTPRCSTVPAPAEAEARSRLSVASFSREQEFEADQIGIKAVARAGYAPMAPARFLTALGEWSALSASIPARRPPTGRT